MICYSCKSNNTKLTIEYPNRVYAKCYNCGRYVERRYILPLLGLDSDESFDCEMIFETGSTLSDDEKLKILRGMK